MTWEGVRDLPGKVSVAEKEADTPSVCACVCVHTPAHTCVGCTECMHVAHPAGEDTCSCLLEVTKPVNHGGGTRSQTIQFTHRVHESVSGYPRVCVDI